MAVTDYKCLAHNDLQKKAYKSLLAKNLALQKHISFLAFLKTMLSLWQSKSYVKKLMTLYLTRTYVFENA